MNGQTAVVTGASRGIGAAIARRFANAGAHVVICARAQDELDEVTEHIEDSGGTATAIRADIRDEFDVERLMQMAAREGGELDYVVANAGVYHGDPGQTPLSRESYAAFDDHFRTNARGVFATIHEALPHLAPSGRILVSSGVVARDPQPGFGSYAVSKAAAEAVALRFAADVSQPVGVVDPGQVATELTNDQGRTPEDAADQFLWAARDADGDTVDGAVLDRRAWRENTA